MLLLSAICLTTCILYRLKPMTHCKEIVTITYLHSHTRQQVYRNKLSSSKNSIEMLQQHRNSLKQKAAFPVISWTLENLSTQVGKQLARWHIEGPQCLDRSWYKEVNAVYTVSQKTSKIIFVITTPNFHQICQFLHKDGKLSKIIWGALIFHFT